MATYRITDQNEVKILKALFPTEVVSKCVREQIDNSSDVVVIKDENDEDSCRYELRKCFISKNELKDIVYLNQEETEDCMGLALKLELLKETHGEYVRFSAHNDIGQGARFYFTKGTAKDIARALERLAQKMPEE